MADEWRRMHTAAGSEPSVTNKVAKCKVCGVQWQVRNESGEMGCAFCDAPADAIVIVSEKPGYDGVVIQG